MVRACVKFPKNSDIAIGDIFSRQPMLGTVLRHERHGVRKVAGELKLRKLSHLDPSL
jgi:hypothetical protein